MKNLPTAFFKFSTAGNTTLFIEKSPHIRQAMELVLAEQGGSVNTRTDCVAMAGGEFCLNACLAYAALIGMEGRRDAVLNISGMAVKVSSRDAQPDWQAKASFDAGVCKLKQTDDSCQVVSLPGISHALLKCETFPEKAEAMREGKQLFAKLDLLGDLACGIIWWRHARENLEIMPLVFVPGAGTFNLEGACGSGSVALALSLGPGEYSILQPSGDILKAQVTQGSVSLSGPVRLMARGEMWLD